MQHCSTKVSTIQPTMSQAANTGHWTDEEHHLFLQGLEQYGRKWKTIATLIKSRSAAQVGTHAQGYFRKLSNAAGQSGGKESKKKRYAQQNTGISEEQMANSWDEFPIMCYETTKHFESKKSSESAQQQEQSTDSLNESPPILCYEQGSQLTAVIGRLADDIALLQQRRRLEEEAACVKQTLYEHARLSRRAKAEVRASQNSAAAALKQHHMEAQLAASLKVSRRLEEEAAAIRQILGERERVNRLVQAEVRASQKSAAAAFE